MRYPVRQADIPEWVCRTIMLINAGNMPDYKIKKLPAAAFLFYRKERPIE